MDAITSAAKMQEALGRVYDSALASVFGWSFDIEDLIVLVKMVPRTRTEEFKLRIGFNEYPRRAPSYVFVDRSSLLESETAWPPGVKHGNSPEGICTPGTREFHEHYHKNDARHPWNPETYTVLSTLTEIHRLMERGLGG